MISSVMREIWEWRLRIKDGKVKKQVSPQDILTMLVIVVMVIGIIMFGLIMDSIDL